MKNNDVMLSWHFAMKQIANTEVVMIARALNWF